MIGPRRRLVVVLACMGAAVACGSPVERARDPRPAAEAAAPATATAAPAAVPTGYRLLEAAGEGFVLAVPEAWHDVPDAKLQAAGAQEVAREKVALSAGPALRTTYVLPVTTRDGASQRVFGVQYHVPAPEAVFVLNLSTPDLAAYQADFDRTANSFGLR